MTEGHQGHGRDAHGKSWDEYWRDSAHDRGLFAIIAKLYRRFLISPSLRHHFRKYFRDDPGRIYLHAGCGSAESDRLIGFTSSSFVLMDLSFEALRIAERNSTVPNVKLVCGDIFHPPFRRNTFDGIWNLGVLEHFEPAEIERIFTASREILKCDGRLLIFWPPKYGLSVLFLTTFLRIANAIRRSPLHLYPDEVSLFSSAEWAGDLLRPAGLILERTDFGIRDLFTYVVLVVRKVGASSAATDGWIRQRRMTR